MLCLVFPLVFVAYPRGISSSPFALSHPRPSWNKHAECNGSMNLSSCVCVCISLQGIVSPFVSMNICFYIHSCLIHFWLRACCHTARIKEFLFSRYLQHTLPTLHHTASPQLRKHCLGTAACTEDLLSSPQTNKPHPSQTQSNYPPHLSPGR